MIRISKGNAPAHLIAQGTIQTGNDNTEYLDHKEDYDSGVKKFKAKSTIYNSAPVRNTLLGLQHGKCCYCETKGVRSNIDVEHFRPKAAYSETSDGVSKYPGYFWLAYNWDNLFLSCQVCNQIFKNDFFPIADEATRAQQNGLSIAGEQSILVHPSIDIPEEHIAYRESIPFGLSDRGDKTLEYLGFGKVDTSKDYSAKKKPRIKLLVEARMKHYNIMKTLFEVVQVFSSTHSTPEQQQVLASAKATLESAQLPTAEWSAMISCAVANGFKEY